MGKGDIYVKKMLENPKYVADLYNARMFEGKQVIRSEDLMPVPSEAGIVFVNQDGKERVLERRRDVVMRMKNGAFLSILACEVQENIHYGMPVRNLLYDALDYAAQIQCLEEEHRKRGDLKSSEEFLSGIKKDDVISPVITLVFYYGKKAWDGNCSLYEMIAISYGFTIRAGYVKME